MNSERLTYSSKTLKNMGTIESEGELNFLKWNILLNLK